MHLNIVLPGTPFNYSELASLVNGNGANEPTATYWLQTKGSIPGIAKAEAKSPRYFAVSNFQTPEQAATSRAEQLEELLLHESAELRLLHPDIESKLGRIVAANELKLSNGVRVQQLDVRQGSALDLDIAHNHPIVKQ